MLRIKWNSQKMLPHLSSWSITFILGRDGVDTDRLWWKEKTWDTPSIRVNNCGQRRQILVRNPYFTRSIKHISFQKLRTTITVHYLKYRLTCCWCYSWFLNIFICDVSCRVVSGRTAIVTHHVPYLQQTPRSVSPLTPNDLYMSRTAPLTSKRCILSISSTNIGTECFKHALYSPFFFSSKCSLFHNANLFGSCIIHILYTGVLKLKKNNSGAKGLSMQKSKENFLGKKSVHPQKYTVTMLFLLF